MVAFGWISLDVYLVAIDSCYIFRGQGMNSSSCPRINGVVQLMHATKVCDNRFAVCVMRRRHLVIPSKLVKFLV